MDNAYQQKLQERADLLHIKWTQAYRENKDVFDLLAALTLEWCKESVVSALKECMPPESEAYEKGELKYLIQGYLSINGFIPPKTDNNETEKS